MSRTRFDHKRYTDVTKGNFLIASWNWGNRCSLAYIFPNDATMIRWMTDSLCPGVLSGSQIWSARYIWWDETFVIYISNDEDNLTTVSKVATSPEPSRPSWPWISSGKRSAILPWRLPSAKPLLCWNTDTQTNSLNMYSCTISEIACCTWILNIVNHEVNLGEFQIRTWFRSSEDRSRKK
jgi:hypothetical protein